MRNFGLLAVIAGIMFGVNLGSTHLWDIDEAIFTQAAREMFDRGEYVVPYFNAQVFPDKPPLMYWLMISAFHVLGPTELAARLWSAIFGIGSVLLTARLGQRLFSPRAGFWAGLVLATSLNFNVIARAATPDSFLTFFVALAILAFVEGAVRAGRMVAQGKAASVGWSGLADFRPNWIGYALMYSVMGLAVLTKGPLIAVLPAAIVGLFLLIERQAVPVQTSDAGYLRGTLRWLGRVFAPLHFLKTFWSMRPVTGAILVLAIALPWYVLVGLRTDGQWLIDFFGVHNFGRFLHPMENHGGPFFYYLLAIAIGFFPWSVLAGPSLIDLKRKLTTDSHWKSGYTLVGCWLAVWLGLFSLAGTKLPSYIMPAYPALALFMGAFVESWLRDPATVAQYWNRMIWGTVALVGIGLFIALPIVASRYLAGEWFLALVGLVPLTAAACGWYFGRAGNSLATIRTLAALGIALPLAMLAGAAVYVDRYQDSPLLAETLQQHAPTSDPKIGEYHYFRPSLVFYLNQPVDRLSLRERAESFFAEHPQSAFMFTNDEAYTELARYLPDDVVVLAAQPQFLKRGNVLLLGRKVAETAKAGENPRQ